MQIIPVIDLKNGRVVHAKQGNRDDYAPIQSKLCKTSDIFDVVDAFCTLFSFPTMYIADLNAITRQHDNVGLLYDLLTTFPKVTFWIDGGYPLCNNGLHKLNNFFPVLGSESFHDDNVSDIKKFKFRFILSLDFSIAGEMGAKALFSDQDFWPEQIIIMSLPYVGSNNGPDLTRLAAFRDQYPKQKFIAAGGIRDGSDLSALAQIGVHQALVATALHNGSISPDDIVNFSAT